MMLRRRGGGIAAAPYGGLLPRVGLCNPAPGRRVQRREGVFFVGSGCAIPEQPISIPPHLMTFGQIPPSHASYTTQRINLTNSWLGSASIGAAMTAGPPPPPPQLPCSPPLTGIVRDRLHATESDPPRARPGLVLAGDGQDLGSAAYLGDTRTSSTVTTTVLQPPWCMASSSSAVARGWLIRPYPRRIRCAPLRRCRGCLLRHAPGAGDRAVGGQAWQLPPPPTSSIASSWSSASAGPTTRRSRYLLPSPCSCPWPPRCWFWLAHESCSMQCRGHGCLASRGYCPWLHLAIMSVHLVSHV
uniref:Hppd1 n=1 Tax=Arundo donax TaxID=35708 RepID=A0A0A9DUP6_ARUDO